MAFKPKRMTDPKGVKPDVMAENAVDYSNFRFRDGYVVSEDQSPMEDAVEVGSAVVAGDDLAEVQSSQVPETAAQRRAREKAEKDTAGKATNGEGEPVQTA